MLNVMIIKLRCLVTTVHIQVLEYKSQIIHIDLLKPFILKMHNQLLGGHEEQPEKHT
jgi:hypothetical protein